MSEPQTPPPPARPTPPTPPTQPAQKKGLSPVAWILIGCFGVLLLGALGVGACGMFVSKKIGSMAEDFAENPGRAAAELVVRMNPDLELVSTDDEAQTITVLNTETGEEFTADWSDIENGNFSFSSDEGSFNIDTSGGEDGAVVSMTSDDGTTTQIFGSGATKEIPDWAPTTPGAGETQGTYSTSDGTKASGAFNYTTSESVAQVLEFYERTLTDQGYEVSKNTFSSGGMDGGMVAGNNESSGRSVSASIGTGKDGETVVTVTYSSGN